jgi:hypothetical protein
LEELVNIVCASCGVIARVFKHTVQGTLCELCVRSATRRVVTHTIAGVDYHEIQREGAAADAPEPVETMRVVGPVRKLLVVSR